MVDDPVDDIKKNPAIPEFYEFDEVDVELYGDAILNPPSKYRKLDSYNFKVSHLKAEVGKCAIALFNSGNSSHHDSLNGVSTPLVSRKS